MTLAYLSLSSYHAKVEVVVETESNGYYNRSHVPIEVFWSDPNLLRVDTARLIGGTEFPAAAFASREVITLRPFMYDRLMRPNRPMKWLAEPRGASIEIASARLLDGEPIQIAGKAQPCQVLEITCQAPASDVAGEKAVGEKAWRTLVRLWVDKSSHLVLKVMMEINPVLADSEFQFRPPAGARVLAPV